MEERVTENEAALPVDAAVAVRVSQDLFEASVTVDPPVNGGAPMTPEKIMDALKAAKVVYGIDVNLIKRFEKHPVYSQEMVVARGLKPVDGQDGHIKYNFRIIKEAHPKQLADGTVDYRDLGLIENTHKDTVLCDITLPTKGTEGIAVTGRKIAQRPGRAVDSPLGRNVRYNPEGTEVIASVSGQVTLVNSKVNVDDTFTVSKDVDNSTGNIVFIGNVKVYGTVREGFLIDAGGNVDIYGNIEAASVKAGGYINARGGVVGRNQSVIECKGDLTSTYLENCTVMAGGSITAESIMNCSVKCGKTLELLGIRAKLIGGRCIVCQDIIANVIGSPANLVTELILGVDPSVMTRHAELVKEIDLLQSQISQLEKIVALLTQYEAAGRLPPDKVAMLASSKLSLNVNNTKLKIKQKELELTRQKIDNAGTGKVVCRGVMYNGVRLKIGPASLEVREPYEYSTFYCKDGKIETGTPS